MGPTGDLVALATMKLAKQLENLMSFALYMVGFIIFLAGLIWAAVVAGVPQLYIGIGVLVLLGIGIFSAVSKTRSKDPPVN
jgi:hypothetical protein